MSPYQRAPSNQMTIGTQYMTPLQPNSFSFHHTGLLSGTGPPVWSWSKHTSRAVKKKKKKSLT